MLMLLFTLVSLFFQRKTISLSKIGASAVETNQHKISATPSSLIEVGTSIVSSTLPFSHFDYSFIRIDYSNFYASYDKLLLAHIAFKRLAMIGLVNLRNG